MATHKLHHCSSPSFISHRHRHSPSSSRALTIVALGAHCRCSQSSQASCAHHRRSPSVEEGVCGYDDDDEQQWPNETEMVAEVRQRVSNMAGVMKKEVRIVASPHRICPLGDYTDHQKRDKAMHTRAVYLFNFLAAFSCVPHLSTPPVTNTSVPGSQGTAIIAPKPIRATPDLVTGLEDLSWPWTWSLN
ncbi:Galacturonokinase [Arachis hypogaea]|nr:Galacturonokinase [Arachis hypogaea]